MRRVSSRRRTDARARCASAALLALAYVSVVNAGPEEGARARVVTALPDWRGIWQSSAWDLDVSGRTAGGEPQLRATLQLVRPPPYNAKWQAAYERGMKDTAAVTHEAQTIKACTRGFPAILEGPQMFEVAVLPEETLVVWENDQVRHIYTDGRQHPSGDDIWPTRFGDSIGHWDGDTLVIDTVARRSEQLAPRAPFSVLSEGAHFTERLHRVSANEMDDEITIDDPTTLAHPWQMTLKFKRLADMNRLLPYDCTENDRNPIVDGKLIIAPP